MHVGRDAEQLSRLGETARRSAARHAELAGDLRQHPALTEREQQREVRLGKRPHSAAGCGFEHCDTTEIVEEPLALPADKTKIDDEIGAVRSTDQCLLRRCQTVDDQQRSVSIGRRDERADQLHLRQQCHEGTAIGRSPTEEEAMKTASRLVEAPSLRRADST